MFVPLPVSLPATLYDRLDAMAQAKGLSITDCVREAIERRLSQYEDDRSREACGQRQPQPGPDAARKACAQRLSAPVRRATPR